MKKLIEKYKELILYVVFGVLTTLVNFLSYELFNFILGRNLYLVSEIIAWFLSVVFAYITNKLFVFESRSWKAKIISKEILSFFSARVLSGIIEWLGLLAFVELLNFDKYQLDVFGYILHGDMIAKLLLAVIVVILNYIFSKLVIFKKKDK